MQLIDFPQPQYTWPLPMVYDPLSIIAMLMQDSDYTPFTPMTGGTDDRRPSPGD